jgi:hypothetical protein
MSKRKERIIIKVQSSLSSSDGKCYILAYDESKEHRGEFEATKEIIDIMDSRPKVFFYCRLKGTRFVIEEEAPWQEW